MTLLTSLPSKVVNFLLSQITRNPEGLAVIRQGVNGGSHSLFSFALLAIEAPPFVFSTTLLISLYADVISVSFILTVVDVIDVVAG